MSDVIVTRKPRHYRAIRFDPTRPREEWPKDVRVSDGGNRFWVRNEHRGDDPIRAGDYAIVEMFDCTCDDCDAFGCDGCRRCHGVDGERLVVDAAEFARGWVRPNIFLDDMIVALNAAPMTSAAGCVEIAGKYRQGMKDAEAERDAAVKERDEERERFNRAVIDGAKEQVRAERAETKWQDYEREYILPCFVWAKEAGIDLEALVHEHAGRNCVDILVHELRTRAEKAEHARNEAQHRSVESRADALTTEDVLRAIEHNHRDQVRSVVAAEFLALRARAERAEALVAAIRPLVSTHARYMNPMTDKMACAQHCVACAVDAAIAGVETPGPVSP